MAVINPFNMTYEETRNLDGFSLVDSLKSENEALTNDLNYMLFQKFQLLEKTIENRGLTYPLDYVKHNSKFNNIHLFHKVELLAKEINGLYNYKNLLSKILIELNSLSKTEEEIIANTNLIDYELDYENTICYMYSLLQKFLSYTDYTEREFFIEIFDIIVDVSDKTYTSIHKKKMLETFDNLEAEEKDFIKSIKENEESILNIEAFETTI